MDNGVGYVIWGWFPNCGLIEYMTINSTGMKDLKDCFKRIEPNPQYSCNY